MPSYAYQEDDTCGHDDITEVDIAECDDLGQLEEWAAGFDAVSEDIIATLRGAREAGIETSSWVFRATQKLGYLGRGQSRLRRRMKQLGHDPSPLGAQIDKLSRKIQALRAEAGISMDFMRLAGEQMVPAEYHALAEAALAAVANREAKEREQAISLLVKVRAA